MCRDRAASSTDNMTLITTRCTSHKLIWFTVHRTRRIWSSAHSTINYFNLTDKDDKLELTLFLKDCINQRCSGLAPEMLISTSLIIGSHLKSSYGNDFATCVLYNTLPLNRHPETGLRWDHDISWLSGIFRVSVSPNGHGGLLWSVL